LNREIPQTKLPLHAPRQTVRERPEPNPRQSS
jgi:hypothetical protein